MVTEFYSNEKSAFSNLDNVLFENYLVFGYKFKEMLDSVALAVTDKTLNAAKIADCEKTNFALIDDILKQLKTNAGPCFKGYVTDDKYLIGNVTLLFKSISQAAFTPLNNVTLCLKSNALTDAKSINAASNCTVAAFVTCLGYVSFCNLEI